MSLHSNMFGWDYVWRDFAETKKGEVITEGNRPDGEIQGLVVPAVGGATVSITPVSAGTAAVIDFAPSGDFMFSIYKERPLHHLSKAFGMQDIVIGDKQFDSQFIIKSNNEAQLKQLFADKALRDLILSEDTADLRILPEEAGFDPRWMVRPSCSVIVYSRPVLIDHFDHLEGIYNILCKTLNHLEHLGLGKAAVNGSADQSTTSGKLHSPLLDRR